MRVLIADGMFALCDGLRRGHIPPGLVDCMNQEGGDTRFFNLYTVNGFYKLHQKTLSLLLRGSK